MSTITVRIPDELNNILTEGAKVFKRSKSFLIREAIEEYIKQYEKNKDKK